MIRREGLWNDRGTIYCISFELPGVALTPLSPGYVCFANSLVLLMETLLIDQDREVTRYEDQACGA